MEKEIRRNGELGWVEKISYMMDSSFRLPSTKFRFGLDPLVGLIPFFGEFITFSISVALVLIMARHGASRKVVFLFMLNILIDSILGSIPFLGRLFDFGFKANDRNIRLLKKHYEKGKYQGKGFEIIFILLFIAVLIVAGLVYISWKLTVYLWDLIVHLLA